MHTPERRANLRHAMNSNGCAIIDGHNVDLITHDISLDGALVELASSPHLHKGAKLRVRLNVGFIGRAIVCRISRHNNVTLYGLRFDRFDFHSDLALNAYFVKFEHHFSGASTIH